MQQPLFTIKNAGAIGSQRKERSMKTYQPITGEVLAELRSIVGEKYVWTDPEHLE